MPSVATIRLGKRSTALSSWVRSLGQKVAAAATEPFRDRLAAGRDFLDLREHLHCLGEALEAMYAELAAREDRLAGALEALRQRRRLREALFQELRAKLLGVADGFRAAYGRDAVRRWLWDLPRLPTDPRGLHQVAKRCHAVLTDPSRELPPPQWGAAPDLAAMARAVKGPMNGLGKALVALPDGEAEASHAQALKDETKARLAEYAPKVERYCQAFAELSGQDRMAERLRRSLG